MQAVLFRQDYESKQKTATLFERTNKKFATGVFKRRTTTGDTGISYALYAYVSV